MEIRGFAGPWVPTLGLQKADLGVALLFQADLGLGNGLLEGMDFSVEVVELGAGGVEPVVLAGGIVGIGRSLL